MILVHESSAFSRVTNRRRHSNTAHPLFWGVAWNRHLELFLDIIDNGFSRRLKNELCGITVASTSFIVAGKEADKPDVSGSEGSDEDDDEVDFEDGGDDMSDIDIDDEDDEDDDEVMDFEDEGDFEGDIDLKDAFKDPKEARAKKRKVPEYFIIVSLFPAPKNKIKLINQYNIIKLILWYWRPKNWSLMPI